MKRVLLLSLIVCIFSLMGCQSSKLHWVNTEVGLPASCAQTVEYKNATLEYCLVENGKDGKWYVEGVADFSKTHHKIAQSMTSKFKMYLYKDDEEVGLINLSSRGNSLSKPIYLYKEFDFDEEFDQVYFAWNIRYKY